MYRMMLAAPALALGLAGCSLGIGAGSDSPTLVFKTDFSYQEAYGFAREQAELCLLGKESYALRGNVDTAGKTAQVRVTAPFTDNDMARVEIKASGEQSADVTVTMWGVGIWNAAAARAMRDAVQYGVPSCTAFMPGDPPKDKSKSRR